MKLFVDSALLGLMNMDLRILAWILCKYRSVLKEDYATSENMRWNMFKVWLDKRVSVKWSNLDWSSGTRYTKA